MQFGSLSCFKMSLDLEKKNNRQIGLNKKRHKKSVNWQKNLKIPGENPQKMPKNCEICG